jgi:DNA-binding NtrC family response regulator
MILVVDDEAGIRDMLSLLLSAWGYQVEVAEDGAQGLRALERQMFDLVISDVRMPNLRGDALAKDIGIRWPHLPVILMTGFDDVERTGNPSVVAILHKPVPTDTLFDLVAGLTGR